MDLIKRILVNGFLALLSVALLVGACEVALRHTSFVSLLPQEGMPAGYYIADPESGYDIAPSFSTSTHRFSDTSYDIWSNELGCFDRPYAGEIPYIYLAGDSFTWGFASFERKWGTLLEAQLGLRTLKCGVPGYGTKQELQKAKDILATLPPPTLILLAYFNNDEGDDAAHPNSLVYGGRLIKNMSGDPTLTYAELEKRLPKFAEWGKKYCMWNEPAHPALQRIKCLLRQNSILYLLTVETVKTLVPTKALQTLGIVNKPVAAVPLTHTSEEAHMQTVAQFKTLADVRGSEFAVVLIPPKESLQDTTDIYAVQKKFLEEHSIHYMDLTSVFKERTIAGEILYWKQDGHWNEKGNQVAAEYINDFIRNSGIISQ